MRGLTTTRKQGNYGTPQSYRGQSPYLPRRKRIKK